MALLDSVIQAYLQGRTVRVTHLVELCFATQARRFSNANTVITAGGYDWFPMGKLGSIDGLDDGGGLQSAELRITLSGADARLLAIAITADRTEYVNRHVKVYLQFRDDDWQLIGDPVAFNAALMDFISVSREPGGDGASRRVITVKSKNMFYGRSVAPASYFDNSDQNRRFIGDRGLSFLSALQNTNIPFPW